MKNLKEKKLGALRILVRLGHKVVARHLNGLVVRIQHFFDNHYWCYVIGWSAVIAVPVPTAWTIFALLIGIPEPIIRFFAVWGFIFLLVLFAAAKDYSEKSALDRALGG